MTKRSSNGNRADNNGEAADSAGDREALNGDDASSGGMDKAGLAVSESEFNTVVSKNGQTSVIHGTLAIKGIEIGNMPEGLW